MTWIYADGSEMQLSDWQDGTMKCFGMLMEGRAQVTGIRKRGQDGTLLMILNSFHDAVNFTLPKVQAAAAGNCCSTPMRRTRRSGRLSSSASTIRLPAARCFSS